MKRKLNKETVTTRLRPDIYSYGKQIAKEQNRSFANLIEKLLLIEIEKAKKSGMKLEYTE